MGKFRSIFAWLLAFITLMYVTSFFRWLGAALGVITMVDLDAPITVTRGTGPASYDEEVDAYLTFYGVVTFGFSSMIAFWVGRATYTKSLSAEFSHDGGWSFIAWLLAFSILTPVAIVTDLAFGQFHGAAASYLRLFVEGAATVGVAWSLHQWWKIRTTAADQVGDP